MKILIVDDSVMMRRLIKRALAEMNGFDLEIIEAGDGKQAISVTQELGTAIDLILCDMNMPLVNGLSLLRIIRRRPDLRGIPFVIVTADLSDRNIGDAMKEGATAVLGKPFRPEEIADLLGRGPAGCECGDGDRSDMEEAPEVVEGRAKPE